MSIPVSIVDPTGKHFDLKLMVTISDPGNTTDTIEWAIFFGVRTNPSATSLPIGKQITANRPLILLPVSDVARIQSATLTGMQTPTIRCSGFTIRNKIGGQQWKGYQNWYDEKKELEDPIFILPENSSISNVNKGEWVAITGETWKIWITPADFENKYRIISFAAPTCHIIDNNGHYHNHEIWFGVGVNRRPFLTIDEHHKDRPIIWDDNGRIEDLITPTKGELLTAGTWQNMDLSPGIRMAEPLKLLSGNGSANAENFVNAFTKTADVDVDAWFIREIQNGRKIISPIYSRHFDLALFNSNHLGNISGNLSSDANMTRVVQVSRSETSLFTHIRLVGNLVGKKNNKNIWAEKIAAISVGLQSVSTAAAIGIVPEFSSNFLNKDDHYISEWKTENRNDNVDLGNYNLSSSALLDIGGVPRTAQTNIAFPNIKTGKNTADHIKLVNCNLICYTEQTSLKDDGTLFQFFLNSFEYGAKEFHVRDGALAFTMQEFEQPTSLSARKMGRLRLKFQLTGSQRPFFFWALHNKLFAADKIEVFYAVEDLLLPVDKAEAAGHNILSKNKLLSPSSLGSVSEGFGERDEDSLIIPLHYETAKQFKKTAPKPNFYLSLSESVNTGQNHRLDMSLLEPERKSGPDQSTDIKAAVILHYPQIVAMVQARLLQQPGYDDGAWVLARRSPFSIDNGNWELLDDSADVEGFKLVLPSQGIGEAYVKSNANDPNNVGEPKENEPIKYRFGAPTILKIAPGRLERRYITPPWSLRNIWGQAGDSAPGAPLLEANFELLYGLPGNLKPEKAFIAEIGSKIGEVPVPPISSIVWEPTPIQLQSFKAAWFKYLDFFRAWKSRLAVLETSAEDDFSNTTFSKNLAFSPRIALMEQGSDFVKEKGADLKQPIVDVSTGDETLDKKIRAAHDVNGLAGGFHYGFESKAIYKEFWRESFKSGSSSAEVKDLSFSSAGGWGKQTARFAYDKTVIKSNTTMGRTHFYAVERIGRIGVFWNKAKHVIEYERTVVPSKQFKSQPEHPGRPLVRKVREYIEILEPSRNYPDFPADAPDAPGSITSCVFKSKIIPVLSSWGNDVHGTDTPTGAVTEIGWEVPLWKPGADAEVYPKPQIQLSLLPPPDSDEDAVWVNISEPQNIFFYTDTRDKVKDFGTGNEVIITSDVHVWPAVKYVDFTNLPQPRQYNIEPHLGDTPELLEAPMPDVLAVFPGFEKYTFRVDRNELPASVAGKYYPNSAVAGRLQTVTMMRSAKTTDNKMTVDDWWNDTSAKPLRKIAKKALAALIHTDNCVIALAANGFTEIEKELRSLKLPISADEAKIILPKHRERFKVIVNSFISSSTASLANLSAQVNGSALEHKLTHFATLNGKLGNFTTYPAKWAWTEVLDGAEGIINNMVAFFNDQKKAFIADFRRLASAGEQIQPALLAMLQRYEDNLKQFHYSIEFGVESVFSKVLDVIKSLSAKSTSTIEEHFDQVMKLLDKLDSRESIATIKSTIGHDADAATAALQKAINKFLDKLNNSKFPPIWLAKILEVRTTVTSKVTELNIQLKQQLSATDPSEYIRQVKAQFNVVLAQYKNIILHEISTLENASTSLIEEVRKEFVIANELISISISGILNEIKDSIDLIRRNWSEGVQVTEVTINTELTNVENKIAAFIVTALTPLIFNDDAPVNSLYDPIKKADKIFIELETLVKASLLEFFGDAALPVAKIESWLNTLNAYDEIIRAADDGDIEAFIRHTGALANSVNKEFGRLAGEVAEKLKDVDRALGAGDSLIEVGQQTLNNYRSVWEEFTAPGMGLNRNTIALIVRTDWKNIEQRLSLTPAITRVKQFGEQLEGLGLRLPIAVLTDRLLPVKKEWGEMGKSLLDKFHFSNILSDMGGMRFDKLFPGFKMPEFARDNIKVTQGFDKQTLTAWVNAEANIKFTGKKALMNIGPLQVEIENANFSGKMRMEIGVDGKVKKQNSGKLIGSWHIGIAGTGLMIFRDTAVIFSDDKLKFDLDPSRMEMPGLLKVLTTATTKLSESGPAGALGEKSEVFKIGIVKVREIPAGVKATLDLPPISIGGGTTAISNLCFGGSFQLLALDPELRFKFLVGLGFYLGKKDAPFTVTVFILGGGGYIDCALTYAPKEGLAIDFVMNVHASASIAIAAGWMTGFVAIMVGFEGEYHKLPNRRGDVYVTIFVRVLGVVEIMSLVTVLLSLELRATYRALSDGSQLVGTGEVRMEIRVCRFVKIKVRKAYSKTFAGSGTSRNNASIPPGIMFIKGDRAQAILNSLV